MASKKLSFEESLEQIDKIILSLQDGDLPLSDALKQYETALLQINNCQAILESANEKISEIGRT